MPPPKVFSILICLWLVIEVSAFGLGRIWSSTRALTTTVQQPFLNRRQVENVTLVACMPSIDWKQNHGFSGVTIPSFLHLKSPVTIDAIILRMKEKTDACSVGVSHFAADSSLLTSSRLVRFRSSRMYMVPGSGSGSNNDSESYRYIEASTDAALTNKLHSASVNGPKPAEKDLKTNEVRAENVGLLRLEDTSLKDVSLFSKKLKKWKEVESALLIYKQLYGNLKVPWTFVIPHHDTNWPAILWGKKLGNTVDGIRCGNTFAQHRNELVQMGIKFALRRIKITWHTFRLALVTYLQLYGDSRIPGDFIVPDESSDWPEELWDMELGKVVGKMRYDDKYFKEHRPEMEAMGFDLDPQPPRGLLDWPQVQLALETYKWLHDDLLVKTTFVVPDYSSNWPEELWGMRLGRTVDDIRKRSAYEDYREELEAMGFDFSPQIIRRGWENVKLALEIYKTLHGDLLVLTAFVVPKDDIEWPEKLWGMKLGETVHHVRAHNYYSEYRDELEAMGFDFNPQMPKYGWDNVKLALEICKKIHGDLRMPQRFIVPNKDSTWPEELWGMPLGNIVKGIRGKRFYKRYRKELVAMGFDFSSRSNEYGWDNIKIALETYKRLYGNLRVPQSFIVPMNDSAWPEELWGMKLGYIVSYIRNTDAYSEYREELLAMGFDYSSQSKAHGWGKVNLALETYKQLYGNLRVPQSFVVPNNSLWPEELWDMKLGSIASNIRNRGDYATYREELEAMGFFDTL